MLDRLRVLASIGISTISFCAVRTQIVQPPVDTRVILGHVATLQCKVSGDPSVEYSIQWHFEDRYDQVLLLCLVFIYLFNCLFIRLETKSCRISYPELMVKYDRT